VSARNSIAKRTQSDVVFPAKQSEYTPLAGDSARSSRESGRTSGAQPQQVAKRSISTGHVDGAQAAGQANPNGALQRDVSYGSDMGDLETSYAQNGAQEQLFEVPPRDLTFYASMTFHGLLIAFGVATLLAQFLD